jgi:hypothetical protein
MFLAAIVVLRPNWARRFWTSALRISPMLTRRCARGRARRVRRRVREVLGAQVEHEALGDHRDAVAAAVAEALDDRAHQRVDDVLEADGAAREFLGNQRERRASRLPDAEGEVPRLASHCDHEVPARRRLGVDHRVLTISTPWCRAVCSRTCRRARQLGSLSIVRRGRRCPSAFCSSIMPRTWCRHHRW